MIQTVVPEWAKPFVIGRETFSYNGEEYEYAVISSRASEQPQVPAVFLTNKSGFLSTSESYPAEYRRLGLIHELIELSVDPVPENGCVEALKTELDMAEKEGIDMRKYAEFRLQFFSIIVNYYETKPNRAPVEDELIARLRHSVAHLRAYKPPG